MVRALAARRWAYAAAVRAAIPEPSTDLETARRIAAGDSAAFRALVEKLHGSMLRIARTLTRAEAAAEEAVQDTWVAVVDGIGSFEGRSSLKTWIFSILAKRSATKGAREARSVPFTALGELDTGGQPFVDPARFRAGFWSQPPAPWLSQDEAVHGGQLRRSLDAALADLPESQRTVVVLRDVEGLEPESVCEMLGISEANQRVLLHRGRSKLRTALEGALANK